MIVGTGIDIIEVERVRERILKSNGFKEKIFSEEEIKFCEEKVNKFEHYAGRFAAKEAFLKASGLGLTLTYELFEVSVSNDELGKPGIRLSGKILQHSIVNEWNKIHLSFSHIKEMACAIVIIEK